jgi:hypothetical protein
MLQLNHGVPTFLFYYQLEEAFGISNSEQLENYYRYFENIMDYPRALPVAPICLFMWIWEYLL